MNMQDQTILSNLSCGDRAEISHYDSGLLPAKFYEMGLQPGAKVIIRHKAPLNGPVCINVLENDSLIAVRISEASQIIVRRIS